MAEAHTLKLFQEHNGEVRLTMITTGPGGKSRNTHVWMSADEAQHLSNRLQAYAKGWQSEIETIIERTG